MAVAMQRPAYLPSELSEDPPEMSGQQPMAPGQLESVVITDLFGDLDDDGAEPVIDTSPAQLHDILRAAIRQARRIPVADFEESDSSPTALIGEVRSCLQEAMSALDLALDVYEGTPTPSVRGARPGVEAGGLCDEVERRMNREDGIPKITSLAFVARMGLRMRGQALSRLDPAQHRWEILSAASGAVRDIIKALGAVDIAICQFEGMPVDTSHLDGELELALRTRDAYLSFRRDVLGGGPPGPAEIDRRLRLAAASIAKLVGREIYPHLRISDRAMLRQIQARIRAFLASTRVAGEERAVEGLRLYQDLASLADLMMGVNRRSELIEHDRRMMAQEGSPKEGGDPPAF